MTKKTVFKWQEGFWTAMKDVFEEHYKEQYVAAGLLDGCGGELQHLISDAATMQIIRWTGGGFGMAAHNYDGDMLTDEVAQASYATPLPRHAASCRVMLDKVAQGAPLPRLRSTPIQPSSNTRRYTAPPALSPQTSSASATTA